MSVWKQVGWHRRIQAQPSHRGEIAGLAPKAGARPKSKKAFAGVGKGNKLSADPDESTFGRRANSKHSLEIRRGAALSRERKKEIERGDRLDMNEERRRARGRRLDEDSDEEEEDPDSDDIDDDAPRPKKRKTVSSSPRTPKPSSSTAKKSSKRRRADTSEEDSDSDGPAHKRVKAAAGASGRRHVPSSEEDSSDDEPVQKKRGKTAARKSPGQPTYSRFAEFIPGGAEKALADLQASDSDEPAPSSKTKKTRGSPKGPGKLSRSKLSTTAFDAPEKKVKKPAKKPKKPAKKRKAVEEPAPAKEPWTCSVCDYENRGTATECLICP